MSRQIDTAQPLGFTAQHDRKPLIRKESGDGGHFALPVPVPVLGEVLKTARLVALFEYVDQSWLP